MVKKRTEMKKRILHCSVALLACMIISCPMPERSVTLKIRNNSQSILITSVTVAKITGVGSTIEDITDNLLVEPISSGAEPDYVIPIFRIADGNGFAVDIEEGPTSVTVPLTAPGPLNAGSVFILTVTGNINSYSVAIESE